MVPENPDNTRLLEHLTAEFYMTKLNWVTIT